ncbi:YdcF family protein [Alteromonas mediterranea]|jgi:uncharacterized SAM-binding protein YcdF (DUF218 family)|uniref:YdcF family protein n=1 Tax=Alteromonas mediterranea TaxID=314275 RepID=UPI000A81A76C|nr:ElyC/SanA/YdcF family protein [Alteromonas mediterranea]
MDYLKQITLLLISPLTISVLLILLSYAFKRANHLNIGKQMLLMGTFVLMVCSQPWVANILLYPLEYNSKLYNSSDLTKSDAIFVPACYYQTQYDLPEVSRWHECSIQRLIQAKILSDELKIPIIVTGGNFLADKDVIYSEKAKQFLEMLGVIPSKVISIPEGTDSQSEVDALTHSLKYSSLITVTSATHQYRLAQLLENANINSEFIQVDFQSSGELKPFLTVPSILALERTRRAIYEYLAIAKYYVLEK